MLSQNAEPDSDEERDNIVVPAPAVTRKSARSSSICLFGLLPPAQRPRVKSVGSLPRPESTQITRSIITSSIDSLDWDPHRKTTELSDNPETGIFPLGDDDIFHADVDLPPDSSPEVTPVKRVSTRTASSNSVGERSDARTRQAQARARLDKDVPGHRQLKPALVKRLLDRETRNERRLSETTIRASLNLPPRPRRVASVIMAQVKELVQTHRNNIELAFMEIEDDIVTVDFDNSESQHIRDRLAVADANKKVLQAAIVFLTQHDNAHYVAALQTRVLNAKKVCVDYIKDAQTHLRKEVDTVSTEAREAARLQRAAAALRRDRVTKNQRKAVDDLDELSATMQELGMAQPVTDKDFDLLQSKCEQHTKIGDQLLKDAQQLHHDAMAGAMKDEALEIDGAVQRYKGKNNDLQRKLIDHREKFEITASRRSMPRNSDLKCPVFSGVGHPDFYTFKTEFDEYMSTQSWTALEHTRMLKRAALQGAPKELASDMDNSDDIWKILKLNYGVAGILIAERKKEIRKVGRCTGSAEKRREWAIDIHSKLTRLHAICRTHNKHDDLYHSEIFGDVRRALPDKSQTDFQDEVITWEEDNARDATRAELFSMLLTFLQTFIQKETSVLRFEMLDRKEDVPAPKPVYKALPPLPDPGQGTRQPKHPQNPPKPKAFVTNQAASPPAAPPATTGAAGKKKRAKKSTATVFVQQSNTSPTTSQGPVFCNDCQTSHEYVFYCKVFQQKDCEQRVKMSASIKTCFRCLRSDANMTFIQRNKWWEDHKPQCNGKFSCTHGPCGRRDESRQRHILMCEFHVEENKKRENDFLKSLDQSLLPKNVKFFFHSAMVTSKVYKQTLPSTVGGFDIIQDNDSPALYMLHTLRGAGGETLSVFYDTGCDGASINQKAYENLKCSTVRPGPTLLNVAGGATIELEHGDEQFFVEMAAGKVKAAVTAIRMSNITDTFPYRLLAEAFNDIQKGYNDEHPDGPPLPEVDRAVGGTPVDVMLGIKYYHLFPKLLFMLPGGLAIHQAQLKTASGRLGILAGTHKSWQIAASRTHTMTARAYFTSELQAYQVQCEVLHFNDGFISNTMAENEFCLDEEFSCSIATPADDYAKEEQIIWDEEPACLKQHCTQHSDYLNRWRALTDWDLGRAIYSMTQDEAKFWQTEEIGTSSEYRCVACRNCAKCRDGGSLEMISLKEEAEQAMLESIVQWNPAKQQLESGLPFVEDPAVQLKPNKHIAEKVLDSQIRLINKTPGMKEGVLISHGKLLSRGFVVAYDDLSEDVKKIMDSSAGPGFFIPWTVVFKATSLSTPVRMVFNGSSATPGGKSLNSILAKGMNTLARLLELVIRFRLGRFAFTGDVQAAYNGIKITEHFYKYQKYLWREDLDPKNPVIVMIVVTLIYGIRPSGQLCIAGFNVLADEVIDNYPEHKDGADVVKRDTYLDDIMRSVHRYEDMFSQARSVAFTFDLGGMSVKAFTYAGQDPDPAVSNDGVHVGVVGYKWASKSDDIYLDIKPISFGKAKRGKLPEEIVGDFGPDLLKHFNRRTLVGKLMSVFDPTGLATPITAKLKLDLHDLVDLKLDWDDAVPASFLDVWVKNLKDIQMLGSVPFRRTIMPDNAANDNIRLIVSCDASEKIAIATVHTQIELVGGGHHVSLLVAKSKLVKGASIPKGELKGAVLAAVLFHVTKRNCGDRFEDVLFVTDSTICLYWIQQDYRPLKATVRNSVIEIRRFTSPDQWFHLDGKLNIADLGTRPAEVSEIMPGTPWQDGPAWMKLDRDLMPLKTAKEITLTAEEKKEAAMELKAPDVSSHFIQGLTGKIAERYSYSKYLVDPCSRPWPKVVRIVAALHRFADNCRNKTRTTESSNPPTVGLIFSLEETKRAEEYFFRKCTLEVRQFSKEKDWKENSHLKDQILRHTGRLLDEQELGTMESVVMDLPPLKFVNPIVDRYSPVAYSIMIYCHRNVSRHRNSAATLRDSLDIAYILGGRDLSNEVRESCPHCRIFKKKLLEVEMGSLHPNRLMVAYPFWFTELDLMGPFIARCEHSCRSDKKVWGLVLKCPTTGAIDVRAMQSQSADAFMNAFSRFAHRFGFPTKIYCDKGSQLIAGCEGMNYTLMDLEKDLALQFNTGIEYNTVAVGMHNANGVVERSIKEVKKLFKAVYRGLELDILNYETAFSFCANELNNIPVCLGSRYRGLSHQDLLSPNRLLLGRNNTRAPTGIPNLHCRSRLLDQNEDLFKAWWNVWKTERLVEYIPQPKKWQKTGYQPKVGDIVLFPRRDAERKIGVPPWVVGQVHAALVDSDLQVRAVEIEYKNSTEDHFRYTERGVRTVAVLHEEGDLELMEQLADAARTATRDYLMVTKYGES